MSGRAQLAQTGLPVVVLGGVTIPFGLYLALALTTAALGVLLFLKFGWRRHLTAGQLAPAKGTGAERRRHGK
ncbi:hypothetical protein H4K36_17725 [Streptomyces sp. DHE7-1]|uniref:hypothetical protein n=1 Tax=unclassified Streptomyces TaxID=2593676 RepID=UPI0018EE62DF|nr:hypothetical protein [Streptomyces sp. DHE7-1]